MKNHVVFLHIYAAVAATLFLCSCTNEIVVEVGEGDFNRLDTLQSGGIARTFEIHLPADYETRASPVVILFHREEGNGVDMRYLTGFDLESNFYGFMAVYPYATSDWAYGCGCTSADANGIDDVQFVADILDVLDADYGINRDSVFVAGFGQGALMAQKVICDDAETFAGLATVGATMSVPLAEACVPGRVMPVLMIQGKDDAEFPWDGAPDLGTESLLGVDSTAQFWASNNGCGERLESYFVGTDFYYNFELYREGFEACPSDGNVVLYRMEGAGHGWPDGQFKASDEIANFFAEGCCGDAAPGYLPRE